MYEAVTRSRHFPIALISEFMNNSKTLEWLLPALRCSFNFVVLTDFDQPVLEVHEIVRLIFFQEEVFALVRNNIAWVACMKNICNASLFIFIYLDFDWIRQLEPRPIPVRPSAGSCACPTRTQFRKRGPDHSVFIFRILGMRNNENIPSEGSLSAVLKPFFCNWALILFSKIYKICALLHRSKHISFLHDLVLFSTKLWYCFVRQFTNWQNNAIFNKNQMFELKSQTCEHTLSTWKFHDSLRFYMFW